MRFKKLRYFVGIAMVIFILIVANILAFGLSQKSTDNIKIPQDLKVTEIPYDPRKMETPAQTDVNSSENKTTQQQPTNSNPNPQPSNTQPTGTQVTPPTQQTQPVVHRTIRTRAS